MILFRLAVVASVMCMIFMPFSSHAADPITFIDKQSFKFQSALASLSEYDYTQIAAVDLNNDSIDEYVISSSLNGSVHEYQVLALTDDGAVSLGMINAQKLMLAYDENNGVRSLLGFKDKNNDFDYDVYAWDANHSSYSHSLALKQKGGLQ